MTEFHVIPELLCVIPVENHSASDIRKILSEHPEIKFVSLAAVDLMGNDTDEKIPISDFEENIEDYLAGKAVQTDGSSVVLPGIATLNDGKVDLIPDPNVIWYIDYNREHIDQETKLPVGTLRITRSAQDQFSRRVQIISKPRSRMYSRTILLFVRNSVLSLRILRASISSWQRSSSSG